MAMIIALSMSNAATEKVMRMPAAMAKGWVVEMLAVAEPKAKIAPMTDAPVISPRFRERLSMPEITPRCSEPMFAITEVLLDTWNIA